jgi:hypothetical protein
MAKIKKRHCGLRNQLTYQIGLRDCRALLGSFRHWSHHRHDCHWLWSCSTLQASPSDWPFSDAPRRIRSCCALLARG